MTMWQEPPLTRREARERERASSGQQPPEAVEPTIEAPVADVPVAVPAPTSPVALTPAPVEQVPQPQPEHVPEPAPEPVLSRRAARVRADDGAQWPDAQPETAPTFGTPSRPVVPENPVATFATGVVPIIPPQQTLVTEAPQVAPPVPQPVAQSVATPAPQLVEPDRDTYRLRAVSTAAPLAVPPTVPSVDDIDHPDHDEHTMTRRELRALRIANGLEPAAADAPPAFSVLTPLPAPTPEAAPAAPSAGAPTSFEQWLAGGSTAAAVAETPAPAAAPSEPEQPPAPFPAAAATFLAPLVEPAAPTPAEVAEPWPFATQSATPVEPSAPDTAPVEPLLILPTPLQATTPITPTEPSTFTPPTGHWSVQAAMPDTDPAGTRPLDSTNSLILPGILPDASGPVTGTGEIIVTGTIDLPRRLASTGAITRLDSSDIDKLIEGDSDDVESEVAPVRASSAISSHGASPETIVTTTRKDNSWRLMAAIGGAVLVVVIVGIIIAGYVLKIF